MSVSFSGFREAKTLAPQAPFRLCQRQARVAQRPMQLSLRIVDRQTP